MYAITYWAFVKHQRVMEKNDIERLRRFGQVGEGVFDRILPRFSLYAPKLERLITTFDPATPQTAVAKAKRNFDRLQRPVPLSNALLAAS